MKQYGPHIFLTGFMGSGKTTLGKKLSLLNAFNFIDLDQYIEQREKRTVASVFAEDGESIFRRMEAEALLEILNAEPASVIALGGGTVCYGNNLSLVKNNGLLIYLELPAAVLAQRLEKDFLNRPLLKNYHGDGLLKFISEKLGERMSFYKQSHLTINAVDNGVLQLNQQIVEFKKENNLH